MISNGTTKTNLKSETRMYGQILFCNIHNIQSSPYDEEHDDDLYILPYMYQYTHDNIQLLIGLQNGTCSVAVRKLS